MAETAAERLNRLQMEDLGTARREYISTVDRTRLRNTRVEVIEATRKSNVAGSEEQRLAKTNKSRLDGWANVYKKIGDTGDLEGLDPLLNGQSHRLQLNDTIRQIKASNHVPSGKKSSGSISSAQNIPVLHGPGSRSAVTRGPWSRGHIPKQPAGRAVSRAALPESKISQSRSPVDSALDVNSGVLKKGLRDHEQAGRTTSSALNIPPLKTRRPISNSARAISSPEDFLAVARSMNAAKEIPNMQTIRPTPSFKLPMITSRDDRSTDQKTTSNDGEHRALSSKPDTARADNSDPSPSSNPFQKHIASGVDSRTISEYKPDCVTLDINSGPLTYGPSEEHPRASSADADGQEKEEPSSIGPQSSAVAEQKAAIVTAVQQNDELLLDLTSVTPSNLGLKPGMSPALEELKGLDFTQFAEPLDTGLSGRPSANRKLDFEKRPNIEVDNAEANLDVIDEELAAEYRREIDEICDLLKRTTLTDTFSSRLTELKAELELMLRLRQVSKSDAEDNQQLCTSKAPVPKDPETSAPALLPDVPRANGESHSPSTDTPRSHSRLNAAAPQFTPQAFTQYRSTSDATSTDSSVSFEHTPSKVLRPPQVEGAVNDWSNIIISQSQHIQKLPETPPGTALAGSTLIVSRVPNSGHIFGDHLLPGGRTRKPIEIKRPEEAKKLEAAEKPVESHIIGDHLLPGRRTSQPSAVKASVRPAVSSVLSQAAAPKPGLISFSIPAQPIPASSSNASSTTKALNGFTLTSSRSAFNSSTLCLRPNNTTARTDPSNSSSTKPAPAILESIHAPKSKPQDAVVSAAPKTTPSGGLQVSRYADPKWL